PNWVTTGDPIPNVEFNPPAINTNMTEGSDILENRVRYILSLPWTVSKTNVLDNPTDYFINNKWPLASWEEYGHIDGAYRIDEELNITGLKYLDPSADIVTYCYTGQTSAITTAWLQALGYDNAKSLTFGVNGIAHSALVDGTVGSAHKKSWKGEGSGSENNFGYYDGDGNFYGPI
ncbi:MAG: rhodanese-like domain-containing protein, partial [Bacteroidia bacterium]|nr:rhodanese-like domain-containing protein [Bacteroidia bacterium]